jgi:hypothetical protein
MRVQGGYSPSLRVKSIVVGPQSFADASLIVGKGFPTCHANLHLFAGNGCRPFDFAQDGLIPAYA